MENWKVKELLDLLSQGINRVTKIHILVGQTKQGILQAIRETQGLFKVRHDDNESTKLIQLASRASTSKKRKKKIRIRSRKMYFLLLICWLLHIHIYRVHIANKIPNPSRNILH